MSDFFVFQSGRQIAPMEFPQVTRLMLALYAGGSGDHNPLHVDIDFARASGHDDVIAHGMLAMSFLGRFLTGRFPQRSLRDFKVRFRAMTHVGDRIRCGGEVSNLVDEAGESLAILKLWAVNQREETKLSGSAVIAAPKAEKSDAQA